MSNIFLIFLDGNVDVLLSFAQEYLMPDLLEKCEHFLQEKLKKLDPSDREHLDLLVLASTHNLRGLARDLIPKVANLSVGEIEKYYGVIKSSLLMCVQRVMLYRYATGTGPPSLKHDTTSREKLDAGQGWTYCCQKCNAKQRCMYHCKFCQYELCATCAAAVCSARKNRGTPKRSCMHCQAQNSPCACAPELAEELLFSKC